MMNKAVLSISSLETVYDAVAKALDQAGTDKAELFLVKLALLNANAMNDLKLFENQIKTALLNL